MPDKPDPCNILILDRMPIPMIRKIERYGMRIDPEHFSSLSSRLLARMDDLRNDILNEIPQAALDRIMELDNENDEDTDDNGASELEGGGFNADSSQRVAQLLYEILGLQHHGVKVKKTKGGGNLTTGKKTLEQLKRSHPVVPLILEYRECSKLEGTYARSMPRKARFHPKGPDCHLCGRFHYTNEYRVHCRIMTTRTGTGRTAHKNPNLANIPIRTALGREIRAGFIASDGHVICDRDWSQIELRLLAHLSGDKVMMEVYAADGDIHNRTACGAFGLTEDQLDPVIHRVPSKNTNFSVVYGITDTGLYESLCAHFSTMKMAVPDWLTVAWCAWFIAKWFTTYPGAKRYLDDLESIARRFGIVWTLCGRVRRIPEVYSCHSYIQDAGVRQAANMPIQGTSADLMKLAMGEIDERLTDLASYGVRSFPINTIYDSLMIEAPEDDAETVSAVMGDVMDNVMPSCRVPIQSDGKLLKRWVKE